MNIPQNRNQNNLKPKITALAITLNEEDNVKRYIQSLSFADEIIFIDSNSTDATVAIAKELGVKITWGGDWKFVDKPHFQVEK